MNKPVLVRASHITPFLGMMDRIGMPVGSLLEKEQLNPDWFTNPNQLVPERPIWRLLDAPNRREGIDDFGFLVTQANQLTSYGAFGELIASQSTLYDAIQTFIRAMPSQSSAPPFWTRRDNGYLWFCRAGSRLLELGSRQVEQHVIALMVQTVRLASVASWTPPFIKVQGRELCTHTNSNFIENSQLLFEQSHTAIAIPIELLSLPVLSPSSRHKANLEPVIPDSLSETIKAIIRINTSPQRYELSFIAAQLDLHERKVQRLLKEEGTTFRAIAGELRLTFAKQLLLETDLSIYSISMELGYTDQANFWRAFVRGTGLSPLEYRVANRLV